jgi:hypothetical protein
MIYKQYEVDPEVLQAIKDLAVSEEIKKKVLKSIRLNFPSIDLSLQELEVVFALKGAEAKQFFKIVGERKILRKDVSNNSYRLPARKNPKLKSILKTTDKEKKVRAKKVTFNSTVRVREFS